MTIIMSPGETFDVLPVPSLIPLFYYEAQGITAGTGFMLAEHDSTPKLKIVFQALLLWTCRAHLVQHLIKLSESGAHTLPFD
ncbi:hypothetical protein NQ315_011626 [Exocentrus adspersus]|uniref:Uncharacterized protein n=1 Tax=Exocentrus adspersus TaxID=1586481 RepID=A0AAV8VVA8_9CUCU|nr:hypothetical protein NQ315_011626 [Exocentrus adspersus]